MNAPSPPSKTDDVTTLHTRLATLISGQDQQGEHGRILDCTPTGGALTAICREVSETYTLRRLHFTNESQEKLLLDVRDGRVLGVVPSDIPQGAEPDCSDPAHTAKLIQDFAQRSSAISVRSEIIQTRASGNALGVSVNQILATEAVSSPPPTAENVAERATEFVAACSPYALALLHISQGKTVAEQGEAATLETLHLLAEAENATDPDTAHDEQHPTPENCVIFSSHPDLARSILCAATGSHLIFVLLSDADLHRTYKAWITG